MKVATAMYDHDGMILPPAKYWKGDHPTASTLTMNGGYWHQCFKSFDSEIIRDTIAEACVEAIVENNGTIIREELGTAPNDNGQMFWRYNVFYVVEEPDFVPFYKYAATIDLGRKYSPNERANLPYDGVAEQGPDYENNPNSLVGTKGMGGDTIDRGIVAKARVLAHTYPPGPAGAPAAAAPAASSPEVEITRTLTGDKARRYLRKQGYEV